MNSKKDQISVPDSFLKQPGNQGYAEYFNPKSNKPVTLKDKVKMVKKIGKGRARSMVIGATSIMNKWPDHLLFCWLVCITFLIFTCGCIFISSSFGKHSHQSLSSQEKCLLRHTHASAKTTMPMKTNVFLHVIVNNGDDFDPLRYKAVLSSAIKNHPGYKINLLILFNDLLHNDFKRNSRLKMWKLYHNGLTQYNFFDTSSAERDNDLGVNDIQLDDEPNIHIIQSTFSNYFKHSPLKNVWRNIPQDLIPTTMRTLSIWEHGGIALSWNLFLDKNHFSLHHPNSNSKLRNLIDELKRNFSTSFVKPRDPFEIKKSVIERMKFDLKDVPTDANADNSPSSKVVQMLKRLKALNAPKISKFDINANYMGGRFSQFFTSSEEIKAMDLLKYTAGNLTAETQSSIYKSSSYSTDYYYSASVYDPSASDGLPSSIESWSTEFKLRHEPSQERVNIEIMKYINGKNTDTGKDKKARIRRSLEDSSYSHLSDTSSQQKSKDTGTKPVIKNPFKELRDASYSRSDDSEQKAKKIAVQKLKDELSGYSTESYYYYYSTTESYSTSSRYSESTSSRYTQSTSSEESNSVSLETLQKLFGPMSEENHHPHLYIKEKKGYKHNKAFQNFNIFAIPDKQSVTLDEDGYYMSARKPCNDFLSELITILQDSTDFISPQVFITKGFTNYCRNTEPSKCYGVSLLQEESFI